MAKKRMSVQKRERESKRRERQIAKAEKAAQKRTRRENREESGSQPLTDDGDRELGSVDSEGQSTGPFESEK
jgi:hypothetical protein